MGRPAQDLTGKHFGMLTVVDKAYSKGGRVYWNCYCYCSLEVLVLKYTSVLTSGRSISCGCTRRQISTTVEITCDGCGVSFYKYASRLKKGGLNFHSQECRKKYNITNAPKQLINEGYILLYVGKGYPGANAKGHIMEHRKVMQETLGRTLYEDENVHHKNGIKTDNCVENLELWTTSQPKGQRVDDLVSWAKEILKQYDA